MGRCLLFVPLLFTVAPARAAVVPAASCNGPDVQSAIDKAVDGDTVALPAGTCTWTMTVQVGKIIGYNGAYIYDLKWITLQGAGMDQTILVDGVDPNNATLPSTNFQSNMLVVTGKPGGLDRVTGLTLQGGTLTDPYNKGMVVLQGASNMVRLDHVHIVTTLRPGMYVYASGGVADHNVFDIGGWHFGIYAFNGGDQAWAEPSPAGTGVPFFIEDNTFRGTGGNTGAHDGWSGERVVFRHNTLQNAFFANHGTETAGRARAARFCEVYNNTFSFTNDDFYTYHFVELRGGNGLFFNNTGTGPSSFPPPYGISATYGRTQCAYNPWGEADASNAWDSNDPILYASGVHNGSSGSANLTDTTKNWTAGQWAGYILRNTTKGFASVITANTANAVTIDNQCVGYGSLQQRPFDPGDAYEIKRVIAALDQTGRGQGDLLSGDPPINTAAGTAAWPHQASEPSYAWNNTYNGYPMNFYTDHGALLENRDFFNKAPTGYTPYVYPHPLVSGSSCDLNQDGAVNVSDVQRAVNMALGVASCAADLNQDGVCNVIDVQRVVNAALGAACMTAP